MRHGKRNAAPKPKISSRLRKTLMMTGNPDRIIEFDGAGKSYLSKPFLPDLFVQRVREMLSSE
jgi:DNA-binding response OmpR family regulator